MLVAYTLPVFVTDTESTEPVGLKTIGCCPDSSIRVSEPFLDSMCFLDAGFPPANRAVRRPRLEKWQVNVYYTDTHSFSTFYPAYSFWSLPTLLYDISHSSLYWEDSEFPKL